jgi:hypothetical protein
MVHHHFSFRPPHSLEELRSLLKLRYSIYRGSRLYKFCPDNNLGIDLDYYDPYALHFGLYEHFSYSSQPMGYIRMVMDEAGPFYFDILRIASEDASISSSVFQIPPTPYPVMTYAPNTESMQSLYREITLKGERLVEPSRLSLHPSIRDFHVADFLIASTFAVTRAHGVNNAILSCTEAHSRYYRRNGFHIYPGTSIFNTPKYGGHGAILLLLLDVQNILPSLQNGTIIKMAEIYERTGETRYKPDQTERCMTPNALEGVAQISIAA